jgi:hypothetical protein
MTNLALSIILGIVSSLAASMVWILMVRLIRPRIAISPLITESPTAEDDEKIFRIKIINRSRRAAVDLRFELSLLVPINAKGGIVLRNNIIPPISNAPMLLAPLRGSDPDDLNAYRIRFSEDLRNLLAATVGGALRIRIYARHEVSGVGRVFERKYYDASSEIIVGQFEKGNTFNIVK